MVKFKILKTLKWITISFFALIFISILGLTINNRLYVLKYSKFDTNKDILTSDEIAAVKDVYEYLDSYGDDIFKGIKRSTDLIIFNDSYEFLICNNEVASGWNFISSNADLNKNIYNRKADNPQAFAAFVGDKWIGSMSTKNRLNKYIVNSVPVFFPPQIIIVDDEQYKAVIIHEMVHAYEANNNNTRFVKIQTLHDICENYYDNQTFNEIMAQEAYYLELAISAPKYEDVLDYSKKFLELRERRRKECKMSMIEIQNEVDFEWLEGLARYAEYKASTNSNSMVAKNLLDIDQKVKIKGDERYYTLGMAQALILDKLHKDWKDFVFTDDFSMEEYMKGICFSD